MLEDPQKGRENQLKSRRMDLKTKEAEWWWRRKINTVFDRMSLKWLKKIKPDYKSVSKYWILNYECHQGQQTSR